MLKLGFPYQWGNFKVGDWKGLGCQRLKSGFLRISELGVSVKGKCWDDLPLTPSLMRGFNDIIYSMDACEPTAGGHRRLNTTDVSCLRKLKQPLSTIPTPSSKAGQWCTNMESREGMSGCYHFNRSPFQEGSQLTCKGFFHKPLWGSKNMEGLGGYS